MATTTIAGAGFPELAYGPAAIGRMTQAAQRAADDPAKLFKAVRIVRVAIKSGRLSAKALRRPIMAPLSE